MRVDAAGAAPGTTVGSRSKDLETTQDHMITSRSLHALRNNQPLTVRNNKGNASALRLTPNAGYLLARQLSAY